MPYGQANPQTVYQRVTPESALTKVGILNQVYACEEPVKTYISLFVHLAVKDVHLELVSDLTEGSYQC